MIGTITSGATTSASPERSGLVQTIAMVPPTIRSTFLSATDVVEPSALWIMVMSLVSREVISPVLVVSKKPGLRLTIRLNSAIRISAAKRSPSQVTK